MHEEGSSASSDTNHADEGLYSEPVLETAEAEEPFELDPEVLGVYEQRMTSLFPDSVKPPSPQPAVAVPGALGADDQDGSEDEFSQRPMTKKEKQTAKRRRQRERQRIAEAEAEEAERRRAEEERKVMEAEPVCESDTRFRSRLALQKRTSRTDRSQASRRTNRLQPSAYTRHAR